MSEGNRADLLSLAPARKVVEYETKSFHQGFGNDTSPYQGWPNDEIDQRWEDMYSSQFVPFITLGPFILTKTEGVTLHVDAKMHDQLAAKSELIAMPGLESEYLVGLDVFHQLHCLVSFEDPKADNKSLTQKIEYNSKGVLSKAIQYFLLP